MRSNKLNGAKGGRATAATHDADWREERSRRAGLACAAKYGSNYYKSIRNLRKQLDGIKKYATKKRKQVQQKNSWKTKDPAIAQLVAISKQKVSLAAHRRLA